MFQEGWRGDAYVIASGSVSVHVQLTEEEIALRKFAQQEENHQQNSHSDDAFNRGRSGPFTGPFINCNCSSFSDCEDEFGPAVAELRSGDSLGEQALHHKDATRNATIVCRSNHLLLMAIDQKSYNGIIRPKHDNIVMNVAAAMKSINTPEERMMKMLKH